MRCKHCKQWIAQGWPTRHPSFAPDAWRHGGTGLFTCDVIPLEWLGREWPIATPDESGRHAQAVSL